jgi:hypothetical protein
VPGADPDGEEHPLDVHLAGRDVHEVRERDPHRDAERRHAEGDEEEQGDEHELRRDRRPGSDLELDAERNGIGADEQGGRQPAKARAGEQERQRSCDDEERPAHEHRRPAIAVADAQHAARALVLDRVGARVIELRLDRGGLGPCRRSGS